MARLASTLSPDGTTDPVPLMAVETASLPLALLAGIFTTGALPNVPDTLLEDCKASPAADAIARKTLVPVLGVPVPATPLNGLDSLLSIVQMPKGVPVGTLAIGRPGAANAAVLAAEILAATDAALYERLAAWRAARTQEVLDQTVGEEQPG